MLLFVLYLLDFLAGGTEAFGIVLVDAILRCRRYHHLSARSDSVGILDDRAVFLVDIHPEVGIAVVLCSNLGEELTLGHSVIHRFGSLRLGCGLFGFGSRLLGFGFGLLSVGSLRFFCGWFCRSFVHLLGCSFDLD